VLKPVDGAGGAGIVIGPHATREELAELKVKVEANPRGWMAQRPVALSTSPVLVGEKLAPRHIDLRPFAVNDGNDVWVLPGGLTRVAFREGELKVNSSQGGGSKDTWVIAPERHERISVTASQAQLAHAAAVVPELSHGPAYSVPAVVERQSGPEQQQ
jgi:uncharacterized circularly permuted ATP-grasp superfamily protein